MPISTEFLDTDPGTLELMLGLERKLSPGRKAALVFELSAMLLAMSEAGVRLLYPHANEREVLLRVAARQLDRDLVMRAYGWDPESNG